MAKKSGLGVSAQTFSSAACDVAGNIWNGWQGEKNGCDKPGFVHLSLHSSNMRSMTEMVNDC